MNEVMDKTLYEDIKYGTNIVTGREYLDTMLTIADVASEMVVKTLGPYGKTTIIDDGTFTYPTKDGWSVLKRLRFNDPIYNTLYGILKQISFDLVNKVGDGTTSSFNGANIFMHKFMEYTESHPEFRQADFLKTLTNCMNVIINTLEESDYVKKIDVDGDFSDIYKIANISSNGNTELSSMIQTIYQKTNNPNIYVTLDASDRLSYEVQTGYKLDCNPINQKGYRNNDDGTYTLNERSMIAIFDHNVNYNEHDKIISGLSRFAQAHNCTVFILAPHFDDIMMNIIGTSINSMLQQGKVPNIMMIQVPLSMPIHRAYLSDVVLLTNAQVFDYGKVRAFNVLVHNQTAAEEDKIEDALLDSDQYNFMDPTQILMTCVGKLNKIVVDEKHIIIQDYESIVNKQLYDSTLKEIRDDFERIKEKTNKSTSMLQKDYMDAYQHCTKLFGSMGVIKVGGASELEKYCLKDAVDDAVLACRSAFDHGYIRGLNLTIMNIIQQCKSKATSDEESDVYEMLYQTFFEMSLTVLRNKYDDSVSRVVKGARTYKPLSNKEIIQHAVDNEFGYDLVNEKFMEDSDCTVINSTLTDIEVLKGMISILSTMLTSSQFLSINRNYDRTMGRQQKKEEKLAYQAELAETIATAVIKVMEEKSEKSGLVSRIIKKIKNIFKLS